jgi:CxxC-x17-CxxC domain-containing protein
LFRLGWQALMSINFFAKTNFRNQERVFGIKEDDRRRHMHVVGKTGMGKTNLIENMAIQDIRNGKGVCVVDPHGEFAEKMLKAIPANRVNDVIYFNPADLEFPIAFNILEAVDEDKKNLVASGMMGVFKKIWPDVWSPRMEYILNNTILALLDYPGSTMLGVNRMMSDSAFRKRVYPKIKDPVVKSFWLNEFDKWEDRFRKEAVAAIQNKVGQFLSSTIIRHIVGQPKSTIDMGDIMDKQKILIVNVSKGRIGEDAMRLLGGMIVTKLQLAAMGRVAIPEEERKDFYLYVDEFQNFATESFANILSEARKYRLCLILAHQYINQLIFDGNTTVRDAIFGNVGTLITFRVGAEDAEHLEKEFEPVFTANDLINLAKYQIYLKLMIDGITGDAFSATTLPPIDLAETGLNEEKAIKVSRERYGKSRKDVEERIARWSGVIDLDQPATRNVESFSASNKPEKEASASNPGKSNRIERKKFGPRKSTGDFPHPPAPVIRKTVDSDLPLPKPVQNQAVTPTEEGKKEAAVTKNNQMFDAVCSTCEEKIQVPFKPDPGRPTFCRECLKDYQRMKARSKNESVTIQDNKPRYSGQNQEVPGANRREIPRKSEKISAYVSSDKPLSLAQASHMAPKKFKPINKKVDINLEEIRELINKNLNTKND